MDVLGRNLAGRIYHIPDMSAKMGLPWQRPYGALDIQQL